MSFRTASAARPAICLQHHEFFESPLAPVARTLRLNLEPAREPMPKGEPTQKTKAARRRPKFLEADGELTVPASSPPFDIRAASLPNCSPIKPAALARTPLQPRLPKAAPCCKFPNSDVKSPASSAGPADSFRSLPQLPTPPNCPQITPVPRERLPASVSSQAIDTPGGWPTFYDE